MNQNQGLIFGRSQGERQRRKLFRIEECGRYKKINFKNSFTRKDSSPSNTKTYCSSNRVSELHINLLAARDTI
jgi:pSer/pThr/pTyr-binding forkhead associated (FHA) protein